MALEKKTVTMPMKFGVDESTDDAADQSGLRSLINGQYDKEGAIIKRGGFEKVATVSGTPRGLVTSANSLGVVTTTGITPYVPDVGLGAENTTTDAIVTDYRYLYNDRHVKFVTAATMTLSGVEYTLVGTIEDDTNDSQTDVVYYLLAGGNLIQEQTIEEQACGLRVVACDGLFYTITNTTLPGPSTGVLSWRSWLPSASALTASASGTLSTDTSAVAIDAVVLGTTIFISWANFAQTAIKTIRVAANATVGTFNALSDGVSASTALCVIGSQLVCGYIKTSNDTVRVFTVSASNAYGAPATGAAVASAINLSLYVSFGSTQITAVTSDLVGDGHVKTQLFTVSGTVVTAGGIISNTSPGVLAIAKATTRGVLVTRWQASPDAYFGGFILTGTITSVQVGFAELGSAPVGQIGSYDVSDVITNGTVETFTFPALLQEDGEANTYQHRARTKIVSLDYAPATVSAAEIDGISFIAASMPRTFDGTVVIPVGMAGPGAIPSTAVQAAGAGLGIGTYSYLTVTQQTDTRGHVFIGPASLPITGTTTGGNQRMTLTIRDLNIPTYAAYDHTELRVYRTLVGGSAFHLLKTIRIDPFAYGAGVYGFVDSTSDTTLETGELLYTSLGSGALSSESPPPLSYMWSHRNRLFGINSEQPTQIWFTKEMADPVGPQWNAELIKNVENNGGPIIAGGSLGDRCVLFQRNQILIFSGPGPDNLGNVAADFSTPETVAHGIGAIDHESIVVVPGGILFRSTAGFYALSQDGSVAFVGKSVLDAERLMGNTVAAVYLSSLHQVWFVGDATEEANILVYDVRFNRWSVWTGPAADIRGAAYFNGIGWLIDSAGVLWQYDPTSAADYDPNTATYTQYSTTLGLPWFRGAGHAGDQRVWYVVVTLNSDDEDGVELTAQTYTMSPRSSRSKDPDVADDSYSITVPEVAGPVEVRFRPTKQRCSAFRCDLTLGDSDNHQLPGPRIVSVKYVFGTSSEDGKSPMGSVAS